MEYERSLCRPRVLVSSPNLLHRRLDRRSLQAAVNAMGRSHRSLPQLPRNDSRSTPAAALCRRRCDADYACAVVPDPVRPFESHGARHYLVDTLGSQRGDGSNGRVALKGAWCLSSEASRSGVQLARVFHVAISKSDRQCAPGRRPIHSEAIGSDPYRCRLSSPVVAWRATEGAARAVAGRRLRCVAQALATVVGLGARDGVAAVSDPRDLNVECGSFPDPQIRHG